MDRKEIIHLFWGEEDLEVVRDKMLVILVTWRKLNISNDRVHKTAEMMTVELLKAELYLKENE